MATPCSAAVTANLQNTDTFSKWMTGLTTKLQQYGSSPNPTVSDVNYITYTIAPEVKAHQDCIMSLSINAASVATDLAKSQTNAQTIDKTIKQREADVKVTHDRMVLARNPELTRGYYDGWFPISRPLKHYTIPLLISLSVFFLFLAFFYFLALFGFEVGFIITLPTVRTGPINSYGASSLFKSRPFMIMAGIAVILLILTIVGFTRKT